MFSECFADAKCVTFPWSSTSILLLFAGPKCRVYAPNILHENQLRLYDIDYFKVMLKQFVPWILACPHSCKGKALAGRTTRNKMYLSSHFSEMMSV
jgi:hypothetical protein